MVDPIRIEDAMERMELLLHSGDVEGAASCLHRLHPADGAELLAALAPGTQATLVAYLEPEELADILEQMDEEDAAGIAGFLALAEIADVLDEMEPDMAADLIGELEPSQASRVLEEMDEADTVAPLLSYAEDTAGGIMNVAPPSLRRVMSVAEAFSFIKQHYQDADQVLYLYVLDRYGRLIGLINLRSLILADLEQTIEDIMLGAVIIVHADTDQEEVAHLLAHYDLLALPVVDDDEKLIGVVTVDDVVDVLEEEATEDIYRLAQVSEDSAIFSPIRRAIGNRLPWLYVNLATAILAASVVALFEETISYVVALAVFMPIVAGMGGNAGNQSMTVVVRSLALGEMGVGNAWRALRHELTLGLLHGILLGISMGLIALLWKGSLLLSIVIGVSMFANLLIAATAGVLVPTTLQRLKVDPALASGVFVTTATDVMGFAIFLGLATYVLMWIQ